MAGPVSAHRTPRWTPAEVAVLREHYPLGGTRAVLDLLPGRSWYAIHVKANKLGLHAPPSDGGRRCTVAGDELELAIELRKQGWGFGRIAAHLGRAEASVTNAVIMERCKREGFTPAERTPNGRLAEAGIERLRWMLKKGLKGVEIQLRTGVSASCVAEQRRRYNRELKAKGKSPLPPPGGGVAYSGVKLSKEQKQQVERLFLEGYGTAKVSTLSGVSKTSCTRIRNRLIRRLKRQGQTLPGCDANGKRRAMRDHARHVTAEQRAKLRELILERVPVRRAARICGIGGSSAYRIRDELQAELGELPRPKLPGRVSPLRAEMLNAQAIPSEHLMRFRQLVREHGDAEARRILRAEIAEARRNLSFEQKLELVAQGQAKVVAVQRIVTAGPDCTLGGVTGAII